MSPESAITDNQSRRRRKEARPQELLGAALDLFVEKGFAATRLEDVAARAGVSKGTVYLYFASKEELFRAVINEGIIPALAQGESLVAGYTGDSAGLLREVLLGWWRMVGGTQLAGVPKLMIAEARNFPDTARYYNQNVIMRGRALLGGVLSRGMASGEFRQLPVETTIDVVFAPLLMLAIWRFSMGPCCSQASSDPTPYLETHLDLLLRGLSRPAESGVAR
jgi:AcrR family transcriptional regulator